MENIQSYFCSLFNYKNGNLYWKVSRSNCIKIDQIAGTTPKDQRTRICIDYKIFLIHRVIFAMHHGFMPKYIDHIDGNTKNNCIENLREATFNENVQNSKIRIDNTSGIKGVSWNKNKKKWDAVINKNNKKIFIGRFKNLEDAKTAINQQRKILHGNFARFY